LGPSLGTGEIPGRGSWWAVRELRRREREGKSIEQAWEEDGLERGPHSWRVSLLAVVVVVVVLVPDTVSLHYAALAWMVPCGDMSVE